MTPTDTLQELRPDAEPFIALRRDIHRHPELAFQEERTAALVARLLEEWGYEVERGIGVTGVVGRLRRGAGARRLGLRADMDALPIQEQPGRDHASRRPGVMHACGHDGHTAMLLAAAKYLAQKGRFSGTLNVIFQPAEESGGGALRMIEDGLFDRFPCDAIFAMHNMPGLAQGHLLFREGPALASCDDVTITLAGTGGHGAAPHRAADPVVGAAAIVTALQTIVSRNVDPLQPAVITVGAFNAGVAHNVIPSTATLKLSVRALDSAVRDLLEQRICALVDAQAAGFGLQASVDYRRGYPVLVNAPVQTQLAREAALALLPADRITLQGPAFTGSEDFAFMLERCPGSYLLIGNGDGERGSACMIHNPGYDFDDGNVLVGSAYWVCLAQRYLCPPMPQGREPSLANHSTPADLSESPA